MTNRPDSPEFDNIELLGGDMWSGFRSPSDLQVGGSATVSKVNALHFPAFVIAFLFLLFSPACARNSIEPVFTVRRALNIELFLNVSPSQSGANANTPYNLKPRNYRIKTGPEIRSAGFDAVRLAVDPAPLLRLTEVERRETYRTFAKFVDEYIGQGLNVIFDIHVTGRDSIWNLDSIATRPSDPKFKLYLAVVSSIAGFVANYDPRRVALELFNEPPCIQARQWSALQRSLYRAARDVVPNHTLVLTGPCWSSLDGLRGLDVREYDQNTIYTFHFYEPTLFTFQGIPWLKGAFRFVHRLPYPPVADRSDEFIAAMKSELGKASGLDEGEKAVLASSGGREIIRYFAAPKGREWLKASIYAAQRWAKLMRIPPHRIFVGEFGAGRDIDGYLAAARDDRLRWLLDVRSLLDMAGFSWAVWSDCCAFGIVEGQGDHFDPAALKALGLDDAAKMPPAYGEKSR